MTLHNFIYYFILTTCLLACNRLEDKAKQLGDKAKSKGKQLVDTAINKILPDQTSDTFSIRSIVKDFQNDKSITEIKGIQTNQKLFVCGILCLHWKEGQSFKRRKFNYT